MRIAGVIAAALIALIAWYVLRERNTRADPATPARGSAVVVPTRPPALPLHDDSDPNTGMPVVDATHTEMQALGRRCFVERTPRPVAANQPDDSVGRLELRLRVRITGGTARVETADIVATRKLRDDVRDCIVAASRAASWSLAAPDGVHDIVELFRMGDFIAVPQPASPPSAPPTR
jgi:hypothetical protein